MFCHEAYAEVSDQVDDALSGSYHFMTYVQHCSRFCPVDVTKSLGKIRSAIGRDRAGPYSFTIGMAEATMLHHLEAEQQMWNKIKGDFLSPLADHVNVTKRQKESIDKKMRMLVTRIHTGKRKLANEKKQIEKDLEEYYSCLREPENSSNARKMPGLKKKLSVTLSKYEASVKELASIEKDYKDNIPNQMKLLHDLEKTRLKEIHARLQTLSQILFERSQDLVESRSTLESYISSLPTAQQQHDHMVEKWMNKFKDTPDLSLVSYDLPVTFLNIESAHDISNIDAAEEVFEQTQQKLSDSQKALTQQLNRTQSEWDNDDASELTKFNQRAQTAFQAIMKNTGNLSVRDSNNSSSHKKNGNRQENNNAKQPIARVAPLTRTRMTVVDRANNYGNSSALSPTLPLTSTIAEGGQWLRLQDPDTHDWYYENMFTGETTLEQPEGYVDSGSNSSSSNSSNGSGSGSNSNNGGGGGVEGKSNGNSFSPPNDEDSSNNNSSSSVPFHTDGLSQEEKKKMMIEVQKLFTNGSILADDRYFVRRGMLVKKCRSRDKDYDFFLFNDILLWANKSGKGKFKIHKTLNIDAVFRAHDMPPKPTIRQEFAVQSIDKSFVVMCENFTEKCAWLRDIDACYQLRKNVNSGLAHLEVAPVWKQDAEKDHCPQCKRNFTAFRRKHHCRKCGELRCADCCSSRVLVRGAKPERVCNKCNPDSALAQLKKQQTTRAGTLKPPLPKSPVSLSAQVNVSLSSSAPPASMTTGEKKHAEDPAPAPLLTSNNFASTVTNTTMNTTTSVTSNRSANDATNSAGALLGTSTISANSPQAESPQAASSSSSEVKPFDHVSDSTESSEPPAQYVPPPGVIWIEAIDDMSGVSYYYNTTTKESTWIRPAEMDNR